MIKVFRIEDKNKIGPYADDDVYDTVLDHHDEDYKNAPSPLKDFDDNNSHLFHCFDDNDGIEYLKLIFNIKDNLIDLIIYNSYKHGFVSLSSLKKWFTKDELLSLESLGYVCNVYTFEYYDLDKMYVLPNQIILDQNILQNNYVTYPLTKILEIQENEL